MARIASLLLFRSGCSQQWHASLPSSFSFRLFPTMARIASKVVKHNGYQSEVAVVDKRSDELGEQRWCKMHE